jgi:hypothetical protein
MATGWRLAPTIGKSPPDICQALGSLHQKGAVVAVGRDALAGISLLRANPSGLGRLVANEPAVAGPD